jgi:hypothetical protein
VHVSARKLRSKGEPHIPQRMSFRGRYTPARLHGAPYPLRTAKCPRSLHHSALIAPEVATRRKIPRGVHSIIRYLCRGDHVAHNRRKKKVSSEQETHPCVVLASLKLPHTVPQPRRPPFSSVIAARPRPSRPSQIGDPLRLYRHIGQSLFIRPEL